MRFTDSDLYKWLEAAAYTIANDPDHEMLRHIDTVIEVIGAAQSTDGYINTYHQLNNLKRWNNLRKDHELYCAGHLFQAAIAHYRITGITNLFNIARRFADHIDDIFGYGKLEYPPGHPEIEMSLIELYRVTREKRYLDLAKFFLDQRGKGLIGGKSYYQDHIPVREVKEMAGHAVRQIYLVCGLTDLYLETGEAALFDILETLWKDMTSYKISITGGIGAKHLGESFGEKYELPNDQPYNETCAQIANVMWNWRMLLATGEARFADLMEWTLYNGVICGISMDGKKYFYPNPLLSRGNVKRSDWFDCACCPPNIMRLLASLQNYFATTTPDGLQLHLYDQVEIIATINKQRNVALRIETNYPWSGSIRIIMDHVDASEWTLSLRIPWWSKNPSLQINNQSVDEIIKAGSYITIRRNWQVDDVVDLTFPMKPVLYEAHPYVEPARNCVTISRGPLIYCLEECDQEPGVAVLDCVIDPLADLDVAEHKDLLGGVTIISARGRVLDNSSWDRKLYQRQDNSDPPSRTTKLVTIPYYAWANRHMAPMCVWIPKII